MLLTESYKLHLRASACTVVAVNQSDYFFSIGSPELPRLP